VSGVELNGDVLFKYSNPEQQFTQTFGINLKKYLAHRKIDHGVWEGYGPMKGSFNYLDMKEEDEGTINIVPDLKNPKPV